MVCIDVIGAVHPLEKEIDGDMFDHIIYALNKVFIILREGKGVNKGTIIRAGKILFRLSKVIEAYVRKKNKENIPAKELADRLYRLVNDLYSVFSDNGFQRRFF